MNREIKFRVWNGKKMVFGPTDENANASWVLALAPTFNGVPEQYTGLKDKNGKEIYEGDICHAVKANSYLDGNYVVAWHNEKGRWYYKNQPDYKDLYQVGSGGNLKCLVIGNIHENPELIK